MSQTIKQQYIEEQQHTEGKKEMMIIREALSSVSPHQTNSCGTQKATALLWSRINTISIGHTIYLQ